MGLKLSEKDIEILELRTEGWIAGLQLAGISMQGVDEYSSFINSFSGSHMFVVDYLMEEVLKQQDETTESFLILTSVLNRFSIPLCDALIQGTKISSKDIIEKIDNNNLFIIPLDNEKNWFRYHHLFADLLKQRFSNRGKLKLGDSEFDTVEIHKRASNWYIENNYIHDAYHHALESKEIEQIAKICEMAWLYMDENMQSETWFEWVSALPKNIIEQSTILNLGLAWAKLDSGEIEGIEPLLEQSEKLYNENNNIKICAMEVFNKIPIKIAFARSYLASAKGDTEATIKYAEKARDYISVNDYFNKILLNGMLGIAYWQKGELRKAFDIYENSINILYKEDNITTAISTKICTTELLIEMGRLDEAKKQLDDAFRNAIPYKEHLTPILARHYLTLSKIYIAEFQITKAKESLNKSKELGEKSAIPDWKFRMFTVDAEINRLEGNFENALILLEQAKANFSICPIPMTCPLDTRYAEILLTTGKLNEAYKYLEKSNVSFNKNITYLSEFDNLILSKLELYKLVKAPNNEELNKLAEFINKIYDSSRKENRKYVELSSLIFQSLIFDLLGEKKKAYIYLENAIKISKFTGYITPFINETSMLYSLLNDFAKQHKSNGHAQNLVKILQDSPFISNEQLRNCQSNSLIEPLSDRELEILTLIAKGMSNNDISEKVFLSLNTVKWHNRNIFEKLQVKRRSEAIARARELGIIE